MSNARLLAPDRVAPPTDRAGRTIAPVRDALDRVVDGQHVHITIEVIGPEEAEQMLGHNTHNRRVKDANVLQFAEDMTSGDWEFDGEPIRFSDEGVLLDGQNRLHAIILAGVAVPAVIIRGLAPRSQDVMDTGAVRSFSDMLTLKGEPNAASLAALVRRVGAWDAGSRRTIVQWKTTHRGLERVLEGHPELRDYVNPSRRVARVLGMNPSSIGMLWWVFDSIDGDDSAAFFDRLESGQGENDKDPVRRLHRTLQEESRVKGGNAQLIRQLVFTIKAWNAFREGREVGLYRWRPGGANPETFPEPV